MKKIYSKEEVCIGCRYCEIYCLVEHSRSKDIIKAFKMEAPRAIPRIRVEEEGPVSFALQCRHCEEPECVFACITGAMYKDSDTGKVIHDPDRCIGCWTCIMACPYGVIMRDEGNKRIASKCDLCPDLDTPACVANCPNEALVYS
ncbi:MAG: 4Fe-4S dicluster domain-containing protein [Thermodesulfobacteriota bacterium]